ETFGELVRHAFGEPARVDRDERRAVLLDELHEAVVVLGPYLVRHHRFQRRARHLDGEVHLALVAAVDDRNGWIPAFAGMTPHEEARDFLDGLLRGGKPDALQLAAADVVEALE